MAARFLVVTMNVGRSCPKNGIGAHDEFRLNTHDSAVMNETCISRAAFCNTIIRLTKIVSLAHAQYDVRLQQTRFHCYSAPCSLVKDNESIRSRAASILRRQDDDTNRIRAWGSLAKQIVATQGRSRATHGLDLSTRHDGLGAHLRARNVESDGCGCSG